MRCAGRGRKAWRECVKDGMSWVYSEWVGFRDMGDETRNENLVLSFFSTCIFKI